MKNLIYTLGLTILAWTLMASGCDSGGGGVTTYNAPSGGPKGGSSARFTIAKNRLYVVNNTNLGIYDISNPKKFSKVKTVAIGNNIETIYPYRDNLYIAGSGGMYQYSIANPDNPNNRVYVQHVTGCDPVVANDSMAILTIHGGTSCRGNINELQAYSLGSGLTSMSFLYKILLHSPRGLGLHGNYVYVCDHSIGLYIAQLSQKSPIESWKYQPANITFFDLIPYNNYLICQTTKGITYLDISNPIAPLWLSAIVQ